MTFGQQGLMQGLKVGLDMVQGITGQMQQQRMQAMQAQQMQAQMQGLQPQKVPSKYFPQCAVSKAVTDFPEGACAAPPAPGDQAGLSQLQSFRQLSVSYESFFENLLATSQNSPQPVGVQCLEEEKKKVEGQIKDKINGLSILIGNVNKEIQAFKQRNQKVQEAMEKTRAALYGSPKSEDDKKANLLVDLTPACQTFYQSKGKLEARSKGLTGLKDSVEIERDKSTKFINNRTSYVADVRAQMDGIQKEIEANGLSVAASNDTLGQALRNVALDSGKTFDFGSMGNLLGAKVSNFQRDFKNIQRDLSDVGFSINMDDFDGEFQDRFKNFSKGSAQYFRKEMVSDCVSGKSRTNTGLSTQQIMDGLRHRTLRGPSTTTLQSYKTALQNILQSDAFIQDKEAAIKRLDQDYGVGEIYIQVQGSAGRSGSVTPYELYRQQIALCEAKLDQDNTFSTESGSRADVSINDKIEQAERALKKALNLEKSFISDLKQSIYDRVVNCEGIEPSQESCSYGEGSFSALNPQDSNFCVAAGSTCATQVNGCFSEVATVVTNKETEMKTLAATHNEQVSATVARNEFFLNQIKQQVFADAQLIRRFIPGAHYDVPKDLFVKMPEEILDPSLGVAIADPNQMINELPKKLEDLQRMLEGQMKAVDREMTQYIAQQRSGMSKDSKKWSELKNQCIAAINGYNQAVAQANEAQNEAFGKSMEFCQKFRNAATNPGAGCGMAEELYSDVSTIGAGIQNRAAIGASVSEFQAYCNSVNNEGEEDSGPATSTEQAFSLLNDLCQSGDSSSVLSLLTERAESSIPPSISGEDRTIIEGLLRDPSNRAPASSLSGSVRLSPFYASFILPILELQNSDYDLPELESGGDTEIRSVVEEARNRVTGDDGDARNFCRGYQAHRLTHAFNEANGGENEFETERYNELKTSVFAPSDGVARSAASALAEAQRRVAQSDSGNIGERMAATPCMAQQGRNGSNGFNLNSFDAGQLGQGGMDIINSLMQ